MDDVIDPQHHGTEHIHKFMDDWTENLTLKREIRAMRRVIIVMGIIIAMDWITIIIILRG